MISSNVTAADNRRSNTKLFAKNKVLKAVFRLGNESSDSLVPIEDIFFRLRLFFRVVLAKI